MLIVQKFGGTSVGGIEKIQKVADKIAQSRAQGHSVLAVVSAMAGETDHLIQLSHSIVKHPNAREYDALVSTGEQVVASLLSMTLIERSCPARSYTGQQA